MRRHASIHRRIFSSLLLIPVIVGCAHRGAPTVYPDFDHATARPSLVVVELIDTDYLPEFPECASKNVICMDPPPTWLRFRALQTVYGEPMPEVFYASTTSHYGKIDAYGFADDPMLVLLLTHEDSTVMPRYSSGTVHSDTAGERHLVLNDDGPHWLPCAVAGLREPITDPRLMHHSAVPREHYDQFYADDRGEYFRLEGEFAYPRYSLPMSRLQGRLADRELTTDDFSCEPDGNG